MAQEVSATLAHALAHSNLLRVFSNRDPAARLAAIKSTYHEDVTFYEPDVVVTGHDGVNAKAEELLNERKGWGFVPRGEVKRNHEMLYLAWGFGPQGEDGVVDIKATGADVLIVEGEKVKKFWVIIDGVSDAKA